MNFLRKWLKSVSTRVSEDTDAELTPNKPARTPEPEARNECASSAVGWLDDDHADSSIFDSGQLEIRKPEYQPALPRKATSAESGPARKGDADAGIDPYNTGSFDAPEE